MGVCSADLAEESLRQAVDREGDAEEIVCIGCPSQPVDEDQRQLLNGHLDSTAHQPHQNCSCCISVREAASLKGLFVRGASACRSDFEGGRGQVHCAL